MSFSHVERAIASLCVISVAAPVVMSERISGMMGLRPHAHDEDHLMVREKVAAGFDCMSAVWECARRGGTPDMVMAAYLFPISSKVVDNAKRLQSTSCASKRSFIS